MRKIGLILLGYLKKVLECFAHELDPEKWISTEIGTWPTTECQHSWGGDDCNITHVYYTQIYKCYHNAEIC